MGYGLGIDLGTTHTAAAVNVDGRVDAVRLGGRKPEIPSLIFLRDDGGVLIGEAAQRRGQGEPGRLAREFKRRLGDPVPIMLGGTPLSAHALTARLLGQVVQIVTRLHEVPPDRIVVTHPANWGPYKRELLAQAVQLADVVGVTLRPEPEAAAVRHAATARVADGETVAVYDLGGGTFDAAVLRKSGGGFTLLGEPEGIEQLGGIDFDEAVLEHVRATLGDALTGLDLDDEPTVEALARLRRDCVEAKETLSYDTEAVVPVALPRLHTRVRINRSQFESMIAPALDDTVAAVRRALRSASVRPEQLRGIVLAGGSSRIPLVSELLQTAFQRPVVLDDNPELGIALGAAILSTSRPTAGRPPATGGTRPAAPAAGRVPVPRRPTPAQPTPAQPTPAGPIPAGPIPTRPIPAAVGRASPHRPTPGRAGSSPLSRVRWRTFRWPLVAAFVAGLLAVTAVTAWPRGRATGTPPPASRPPATPAEPPVSLRWRAPTGGPATGPPLLTADRVVIGGADGMIRALRRTDGHSAWKFRSGSAAVWVSRVLDDIVYAGTADGVLYAVDSRTGEQRWRKATGRTFDGAPGVYPVHVYATGRDNVLFSYLRTGNYQWSARIGTGIRTPPLVSANTVIVAAGDGRMYGVRAGEILWQAPFGTVDGSLSTDDKAVCAAIDDGSLRCVAAADGTVLARIALPGIALTAPVTAAGAVFAAAADGTVGAWETGTGAPRWLFRPAYGETRPGWPAAAGDRVFVAYPDGNLSAVDAATGEARWNFKVDDRLASPPRMDGNDLVVVGATGVVRALRIPGPALPPQKTSAPKTRPTPEPTRTTRPPPSRTTTQPTYSGTPSTDGTIDPTTTDGPGGNAGG